MVTNQALAQVAQVGLDLEGSFELAMRSLGLGPGAAHLLWLPMWPGNWALSMCL